MRDESPFAFAGIWDEWQGDEKAIASCAIITTTANELVALIHVLYALTLSRPDSFRRLPANEVEYLHSPA
jgi:putative SOS response-associated peptidase YedK